MKLDEVKEIINMINDSELSYFEVNIDNKYIKMDANIIIRMHLTSIRTNIMSNPTNQSISKAMSLNKTE